MNLEFAHKLLAIYKKASDEAICNSPISDFYGKFIPYIPTIYETIEPIIKETDNIAINEYLEFLEATLKKEGWVKVDNRGSFIAYTRFPYEDKFRLSVLKANVKIK